MPDPLLAPLQLSPALAKKLSKLGLTRRIDLLLHLPLRYEDETRLHSLTRAPYGEAVLLEVVVLSQEVTTQPKRQLQAVVQEVSSGQSLHLRFFTFYPELQKLLVIGQRVRVFGELRAGFFGAEMVHPRCQVVAENTPLATTLTPIYPTTAGLAQSAIQKFVKRALASYSVPELLGDFVTQALGVSDWASLHAAIHFLHAPPAGTSLAALDSKNHPAWLRVKFDEVLAQQLSLRRLHAARQAHAAPALHGTGKLAAALQQGLPFTLTAAQQRVVSEIRQDLISTRPMQRLLQGDVGSGKTIVAALAACQAIEAGWQVAFMAPTEILAEQHYVKLQAWFAPLEIPVVWLTGSLKGKQKKAAAAEIAAGAALAVGTHALIQDEVNFAKLGLSIVDEQHRFGVEQRLALRQKGYNPHQLMMSATPIPRTLAMSYYADLDVSVIDELPPGRTPIKTKLIDAQRRAEVIGFLHEQIRRGRQAYWVCPLIEESEALQLETAVDTHAILMAELPELQIGLVHGRMKPDEKQAVMAAFISGATQVLVATTVIEVGVDVPNASLMVIEHAERFGLSQLHQLRGRVGRGQYESQCILLYAKPLSPMARDRLKIIYENHDGFEIARQDLDLRGPGEFIGSRQSGVPLLRYADLTADAPLIAAAQHIADQVLRTLPQEAEQHLQRWFGEKAELLKA